MRRTLTAFALVAATACTPLYDTPRVGTGQVTAAQGIISSQAGIPPARGATRGLADYRRIAPQVERTAEQFCREEYPRAPYAQCDFDFRLIDDPRAPANAFQTVDRSGRPVIGITTALLAQTGSADEIGFVLSHEAGHHIADHLSRQQAQVLAGALIFGTIAAGLGGDPATASQRVSDAMDVGAFVGQRAYSQSFELEADVIGTYIAARAGFDPERGALIFARPALQAGGGLLSTHPASPQRLATVQRTSEEIRRQQALGQVPRPASGTGRF